LGQGRDHDALGDGTDRFSSQDRGILTAIFGNPMGQAACHLCGLFAVHVKQRGQHQRQDKMDQHHAEAAGLGDQPSGDILDIRRKTFGKFSRVSGRGLLPDFSGLVANQRYAFDPVRGRRNFERRQLFAESTYLRGVFNDGADGE